MALIETTPYFETQQFIEDCKALALVSSEDVETARLAICLKWSEDLIARGGFPSAAAAEAQALFAIGDISVEDMREQISLTELNGSR
jgi:hypothetical protein